MLERVEPNYEINGTGFFAKEQYRGYQKARGWLFYSPLVERMWIRQITILAAGEVGEDILTEKYIKDWETNYGEISGIFKEDTKPNNWSIDQSFSIRATNEMEVSFWYEVGKKNEPTGTYHSDRQGFHLSTPKTGKIQKIATNLNFDWGRFYNFSQKYLGSSYNVGIESTSWVTSRMGLELNGQYTETLDPYEIRDGKHFRISIKNTYLFTKDFFIRLYTQGRWGVTYYDVKSRSNN